MVLLLLSLRQVHLRSTTSDKIVGSDMRISEFKHAQTWRTFVDQNLIMVAPALMSDKMVCTRRGFRISLSWSSSHTVLAFQDRSFEFLALYQKPKYPESEV